MLAIKKIKYPFLGIILISFFTLSAAAQSPSTTKYFDSLWHPTSKDSAFFFTQMVKEDTFYNCTSYWIKSKKINCKSAYSDTLFSKPIGLLLRYYEGGQIQDSTYHNEDGTVKNTFHYFINGKLGVHYTFNPISKKETTDAFNLNGAKIEGFIYMKEASFSSLEDWQYFLSENIKTNIPIKKGAPLGKYQIVVRFIVGINGKLDDIHAETNIGFGMEDEVIRVLKKSPKWNPAIFMGKPLNAYRRQPITFMVTKE